MVLKLNKGNQSLYKESYGGIWLYENLISAFKKMGLKVQNMKYNATMR